LRINWHEAFNFCHAARPQTDLVARREALERELESLLDRVDAHPTAALIDALAAIRMQIDTIDRRLAAAERRRARASVA
jgi:hypothetical protein